MLIRMGYFCGRESDMGYSCCDGGAMFSGMEFSSISGLKLEISSNSLSTQLFQYITQKINEREGMVGGGVVFGRELFNSFSNIYQCSIQCLRFGVLTGKGQKL